MKQNNFKSMLSKLSDLMYDFNDTYISIIANDYDDFVIDLHKLDETCSRIGVRFELCVEDSKEIVFRDLITGHNIWGEIDDLFTDIVSETEDNECYSEYAQKLDSLYDLLDLDEVKDIDTLRINVKTIIGALDTIAI